MAGRPRTLTEEEKQRYTPEEQQALQAALNEVFSWVSHDVNRVLAAMTDESVYHDMTMEAARGLEEIRAFGEAWLAALPDFDVEIHETVVDDTTVVFVGKVGGTHKGEMFGQPGTGKRLWFDFVQLVKTRDGKVLSVNDFWNKGELTRQLGIPIDATWEY